MASLVDPAILFFVFGLFAGAVRSNLEIPQPISRFLSLYLLMALGLKGGFALSHSGMNWQVAASLGAAMFLAVAIPVAGYQVLKRMVSPFDAAAVAATYGSVSAVTFITAVQYLDSHQLTYGGHMAAAMALMESPAIILALVLANQARQQVHGSATTALAPMIRDAFREGPNLLLLGSLVIGVIVGVDGKKVMDKVSESQKTSSDQ